MSSTLHWKRPNSKKLAAIRFNGTHMTLEDFTEQLRKDKVFDVFDVIRVTDASTKAKFEEGARIPKNATVLVKRAPNAEFKPTKRNIRLAKQLEQERERDGLPAAANAPTTRKAGASAYGEADETARLAMAQQQQQSAFGNPDGGYTARTSGGRAGAWDPDRAPRPKAIRTARGIPMSQLEACDEDDPDARYHNSTGKWVRMKKTDAAAPARNIKANVTVLDLTQPAPSRPGCTDGDAGAGPSTAGPAAPPKTERMVQIPEKDAGRMIGRDGQTLKGLEQRSGATIELPGADGSGFRWAKIKGNNDQVKACQDALQDLLSHDKPFQQTKKPSQNQRHGNGHDRGGGGGGGGGNPQHGYGVGNGGYNGSYGTGDAGWGQYGDMAAMGGMYGSYYDFPGMVGIGQQLQFWGGGMPYNFAGGQQRMMSTAREEYDAPEYDDGTPKRRRSRRLSGHAAAAASSRPQIDHPDTSPSPEAGLVHAVRRRSRRLSTDIPPGRPTRRTSISKGSARSPVVTQPKRPSPLKKNSAEPCAPPGLPSPPVAGGRIDGQGRNTRGPKKGDGRGGTARSNNRELEAMRTKARAQSPSRASDARPRDCGRPARRSSLRTKATRASPSSSPDRGPRPNSQGADGKPKQPKQKQPKQPKQPTHRQLNTKQRTHPPQPRSIKDRLGGARVYQACMVPSMQQSDRPPPQQPKPKRGSQGAPATGSSRQTNGTDLRGLLNRKRKPTVEVTPVNPTANQRQHQRQKRATGTGLLPTPASVLHLEPAAKKRRGSKGKVAIVDSRPKVHLIDSRSRKPGGESQRRTAPAQVQAAPAARRRSSARNGKAAAPPPQVSTPTVRGRGTSSAGIPGGDRPRRSSERIRQAVRAEQEPDDAPTFSFGTFSFD